MNRDLSSTGLSPEVCEILMTYTPDKDGFNLILDKLGEKGAGYVVSDNDFPLFKECAMGVAGIITATSLASAAPSIIAGLVWFLYDFRRNGVDVSPRQCVILRELKETDGLTSTEIADGLDLPLDIVQQELETLTMPEARSGRTVPITRHDDEGKWHLHDGI